ncbi:MAG: IS1096 element passenger TnpR family protein, partial [Gaiellaceae bacterium]
EFWGDQASEYTSPVEAEPGARTADASLDDLDLRPAQEIAYLFDFGDQWRVLLRVDEIRPKRGTKGRVLRSLGEAPPQYAPLEEG